MFTGIVEEVGKIKEMKQGLNAIEMKIRANQILDDVAIGDSISVNGVCLTVTAFSEKLFSVDVMPETVKSTSLKLLSEGSSVNLERAMAAGGRFGGHFVTGHVDGVGKIVTKRPVSNAVYYRISIPAELAPYLLYKGSVAVDGVSLTIFGLEENTFTISLIPHTLSETILGEKEAGDIVNLECDMLGKYVEQFLLKHRKSEKIGDMTKGFLEENGFI